jgi:FlgN protein
MSTAAPTVMLPEVLEPEGALSAEVLNHLQAQIASAQRLLEVVLEQGAAIRARDVHNVVRLAGLLHGEMTRRQHMERERSVLLERAGARLGIPAELVTLTRLGALMDTDAAQLAAVRSAELRGLLHELRREHSCNRALMQIELSFLDHLMKSLALDGGAHGYDPRDDTASSARKRQHGALHLLDLKA